LIQQNTCRSCVAVKVRGGPVAFVERSALMPTPGCIAALSHL
jgi:hypothetical protein